jgi:hypothetical protein
MLRLVKFGFGSLVVGLVLLLATCFLQNGPAKGMAAADSVLSKQLNQLPYRFASFFHSAGPAARNNANDARLQIEGMKNSLPHAFAFTDWFPKGGFGWMKNPAQKAQQMAGGDPANLAKKIPIVNGAVQSADDHIAVLKQSLNNAASAF